MWLAQRVSKASVKVLALIYPPSCELPPYHLHSFGLAALSRGQHGAIAASSPAAQNHVAVPGPGAKIVIVLWPGCHFQLQLIKLLEQSAKPVIPCDTPQKIHANRQRQCREATCMAQ